MPTFYKMPSVTLQERLLKIFTFIKCRNASSSFQISIKCLQIFSAASKFYKMEKVGLTIFVKKYIRQQTIVTITYDKIG